MIYLSYSVGYFLGKKIIFILLHDLEYDFFKEIVWAGPKKKINRKLKKIYRSKVPRKNELKHNKNYSLLKKTININKTLKINILKSFY